MIESIASTIGRDPDSDGARPDDPEIAPEIAPEIPLAMIADQAPRAVVIVACAAATTASTVKPSFSISTSPGADAP